MENITQLYLAAFQELTAIAAQEKALASKRQQYSADAANKERQVQAQYAQKRQTLQNQLQEAQGYLSQAESFAGHASPNTPAASPNFLRMQQLFVSIDTPYDPEVKQLLQLATGAVKFLQQQLANLDSEEAAAVRSAVTADAGSSVRQDEALIRQKYAALIAGPLMKRLANAVQDQCDAFLIKRQQTYDLPVPKATSEFLKFGVVQRPFPVPSEEESKLRALFGVYYDLTTKTLRLPFGFRTDRAVKIKITAPESGRTRLQEALQALCFNILRHHTPLSGRVLYLDSATYNPEHLATMKHFCGKDQLITFPVSDKEALSALAQLISAGSAPGNRQTRYLIVRDYPHGLSPAVRDRIRNICNNSAQYRITVIFTAIADSRNISDAQDTAAMSGALPITLENQFYYLEYKGEKTRFAFFIPPYALTDQMRQRFQAAYVPKVLGCKYPERVPVSKVAYQAKGQRKFCVPYGVDAADRLCSLDFSNTNFSMYLMGAAGSGKSTLLHTIITGLIRQYHPDDVELWLADFKMGEFSQYINPMPPHIKYILLDESQELVFDFVELLTQELMRRKQFFSLHPELKKLESVPAGVHMPTIFVIIDEFSLMSQAVYESERHQRLLTNLLTEGRALGFKFIFSSQEYSKGVQGLSGAARDQVQTRIAMKNTVDEIKQTLDLPGSAMTDTYRQWIDTLPPHVALYKYYDSRSGQNVLNRTKVLYFPDGYGPQKQLIQTLCTQLRPGTRYDPDNLSTYVDKHPVIADGTSYRAFSASLLGQDMQTFRRCHPEDVFPEDMFFSPGDPRRLISGQLVQLTDEHRENLLLLTGDELACAMSVIQSAGKAFLLQGGSVQIWSYRRNRLYKLFGGQMGKYLCLDTPQDVGLAIQKLKAAIKAKQHGKELIVMLGMERLLQDLELMDQEDSSEHLDLQSLAVSTPEEQADYDRFLELQSAMADEVERIIEEGEAAGKSDAQIEQEMNEAIARHMHTTPIQPAAATPAPIRMEKPDYIADLHYIVTQGSTCGYHFLLCAEDYPQFKAAKLKAELFRHKISFCISMDDALTVFGRRRAAQLPSRIGLYNHETGEYTFRPYLHKGIVWDGWNIDTTGNATRETIYQKE